MRNDDGFTLIELLVVVLIIAILAAIAIPAFIRQREKAYTAEVVSALRAGATAAEAYGAENEGDYSALTVPLLEAQGYKDSVPVDLSVASTTADYCLTATYSLLSASHDWETATWDSDLGKPAEADTCVP